MTKLQGLMQEKPEYKQMQAKKMSEGTSFQDIGGMLYKVQNGQLTSTGIWTEKAKATSDWSIIGYDDNGKAQYGFIDTATGSVQPYTASG